MRKMEQGLDRLHSYVLEKELFPAGVKLLLCCSGGADSVALVHLFSRLRSLMQVTLLAVHVDHQLRGAESDADAELVKDMCLQLNIPVIVRKIKLDGQGDLENQARKKRFEVFEQILQAYRLDFIVTAHHNNDQAETMLMNLLRGSGLTGMAGIKPRSGKALHPLLCFNKQELVEMLREDNIPWREDLSNLEQKHRRNWIRHTLIPLLEKETNPQLGDKLGMQAQIFLEAENMLLQRTHSLLRKALVSQSAERAILSLREFMRMSRLEQYYVLRSAIRNVSGKDGDFFLHNFEDIRSILDTTGTKTIVLGNDISVSKVYADLIIAKGALTWEVPEPVTVEEDRSRAVFGGYRFTFKILRVLPSHAQKDGFNVYLDADKMSFPLTIRGRADGDRYLGLGMNGSQKVKDLFINTKVPLAERDQVPIVTDGDKIIWIVGHRIDARAAIDENTIRYFHASCEYINEKPMRAANRSKKTGEYDGSYEL